MRTIPVAIMGGGIAGLTLCAALRRRGIESEVFEREPVWRHGSGIWLPPNALQVLQEIGIGERLMTAGQCLQRIDLSDVESGLLRSISLAPFVERFGFPTLAIHRSNLHQILLEAADPASVHVASAPKRVEFGKGAWTLHFESRDSVRTALLAGADGIRSALRARIAPHAHARYSGQGCYRGVSTAVLPESERGSSQEIWAPGRRFGYSGIGGGLVYWYGTFDAPDRKHRDAPGARHEHARTLARGFPDFVGELVETTSPDAILFTEIEDLPKPVWSAEGLVLLGDAAHAVTPDLGQGGAQAVEDALTLANAIHEDPRTAARRYQEARQKKVATIRREARLIGRAAHLKNPMLRWLRNAALRHYPAWAQYGHLTQLYAVRGLEER